MSAIEDEPPSVLLPCTICSRTFRPEVLERHSKVCEKSASKKRRVFDSFKSRVTGTELEEFLGPAPLPGQPVKRPVKSPVKKKAPSKWKETHENLIATLRAARGAEPPQTMIEAFKPAGNEQCPSCSRFFGPRAFDRHVQFCKEKTARIKLTPSKVSQAQERLEARTKYRAPLSIKPKLTTKEKYSPMLPRKESCENFTASIPATKTSPPVPALNKNTKPAKQNLNSFSRQNPVRSSERQRSVSPSKKSVTSSSKPIVKNETPTKPSNHLKVKENTRSPENSSPKPGTKSSTQEKIRTSGITTISPPHLLSSDVPFSNLFRSSSIKLTQSEDQTVKQIKKPKKKKKNVIPKSNVPSDNESNGTVESEFSEKNYKYSKPQPSKWSSAESIKSMPKKSHEERVTPDMEKVSVEAPSEKSRPKTKDINSAKKSKEQKQIINDLSVNDESFGIVVAACSMRPASSSSSKTKIVKSQPQQQPETARPRARKEKNDKPPKTSFVEIQLEEPKKIVRKIGENSGKKAAAPPPPPSPPEVVDVQNETFKIEKEQKPKIVEKLSKIPKPKLEPSARVSSKKETREPECVESLSELEVNEIDSNEVILKPEISVEDEMKKKSKKWRNIAEISTEELAQMSADFAMSDQNDEEILDSAIWEIAGEQFLNSEEPDQTTSAFSLDSLNETEEKKINPEVSLKNKTSFGDGFVVIHEADPSKMAENDAKIKLSVSEPCFPFSSVPPNAKTKALRNTEIDIVVFTAFPNALQPRITHRKRRKQRKLKEPPPKYSWIREKTFLTQDFPKAKRRRTSVKEIYPSLDLKEYYFGVPSEDFEETKKKFIEGLENHREKIREWHATANTQVQFMEGFQKSIEDDLKELKRLFEGKKPRQECRLKESRREKLKQVKEKLQKKQKSEHPKKGKNFEYFEINLDEKKPNSVNEEESPNFIKESPVNDNIRKSPEKFERFEMATDEFLKTPKVGKSQNKTETVSARDKEIKEQELEVTESCENMEELKVRLQNQTELEHFTKPMQVTSSLNSSLENIEEVDEKAENENSEELTFRRNIEIEDFIVAKPDTKKILSKDENCLSQLFPKPRKISEPIKPVESKMAVTLNYAADSVYDLKSDEQKSANKLPEMPNLKCSKILEKRLTKASHLPQISVKSGADKKENSMISLIEMWKHKRRDSENDKLYKTKATLPTGKLAPLTTKNTFQIAALPTILKRQLWESLKGRLAEGDLNDSYDPFKQAERQMLALLSWPSTADIKTSKDLSASPKSDSQKPNLETSPTSAFTKYPNKINETKNEKTTNTRKNLNETFEMNETTKKNNRKEKPTYSAADDWEQIFEQHFDLNRNEMTEQMTRTVKSALDGLLKNTIKNKTNLSESTSPQKNKTETPENSIITDILYTSTPKPNPKSDRSTKARSKDSTIDLDQTPNTYRKNTNFTHDRVSPPEDFHDSKEKAKKEDKTNRNSGVSLSSLSFCSQISDTTLADEEVMRSNLEIIGKAAAAAKTPRRKYIRSQSVFDERNKMLFAKTFDPNCSSSDENDAEVLPKITDNKGNKSPSRNPYPKSVPSNYYRSQSVVEDRFKGDGDHTDDGDHISSPESNRNRKGKLSGDSAYSSLNRRSPRQNIQKNQQAEDRLSSSGSDHSIPTTDYELKPTSLDFNNPPAQKKDHAVKMSKFCHECGSKYPVAVAKFCCECGVRRLII